MSMEMTAKFRRGIKFFLPFEADSITSAVIESFDVADKYQHCGFFFTEADTEVIPTGSLEIHYTQGADVLTALVQLETP